jgi:site-specific DNA-cytosine methylase
MRVLVACEYSGTVRDAFAALGHDAWSCDILPTESPGQHYQGDVRDILGQQWDLMIAHPPCTYLSVSGMHWTKRGLRNPQLTEDALEFVQLLLNADIPRIALENPVSVISTRIRKPNQIIQPWMFGDNASKKTCLWLKGLSNLQPTNILFLPENGRWANQTISGQNNIPPGANQWKIRSKTYQGIANAMAQQWGYNEIRRLNK